MMAKERCAEMVASQDDMKRHVFALLEQLPEESLAEVATFLDFQRYKLEKQPVGESPYRPVPLGGLWRGIEIGDDEIGDVRREIWARFSAQEP